jgi:Flp pilus assembly pilin Flp
MKLAGLCRSKAGSSSVEHALILAIIGTTVFLATLLLGWRVAETTNEAGTCISSNGRVCGN